MIKYLDEQLQASSDKIRKNLMIQDQLYMNYVEEYNIMKTDEDKALEKVEELRTELMIQQELNNGLTNKLNDAI
jgi:hypothetical protein